MGCITKINLSQANDLIAQSDIFFEQLNETHNGITDSTYIGTSIVNQRYILKIYESSTQQEVEHELDILNHLRHMKVPKVLSSDITFLQEKPSVLFSFIEGEISKKTTLSQLEQIAVFLANLHKTLFLPKSQNIYDKSFFEEKLYTLVEDKDIFIQRYDVISKIDMTEDALIHGDLFPDNAKFINEKLNGVYDFGQSCFGNSFFDVAVVIISWCFDEYNFSKKQMQGFILKYNQCANKELDTKKLKPYLLYACLYYALQRFTRTNNLKDYSEYIKKFDILQVQL